MTSTPCPRDRSLAHRPREENNRWVILTTTRTLTGAVIAASISVPARKVHWNVLTSAGYGVRVVYPCMRCGGCDGSCRQAEEDEPHLN